LRLLLANALNRVKAVIADVRPIPSKVIATTASTKVSPALRVLLLWKTTANLKALLVPTVPPWQLIAASRSSGRNGKIPDERKFQTGRSSSNLPLPIAASNAKPTAPIMFARQPEMKVFSGSANRELATAHLRCDRSALGQAIISSFPDGETYVKIEENIRGRERFHHSTDLSATNQHLMELLIMVDAARRASADRITAVIPFFGYARQDRKDQPRVPITAKLVANLLPRCRRESRADDGFAPQQVQGFFDIPVDHLYSLPVLIKYLRTRLTRKTVVVSPDVGGLKMASAYAEALGTNLAIVAKQRKVRRKPRHFMSSARSKDRCLARRRFD